MAAISKNIIEQAFTFESYFKLIEDLVAEGKTTGAKQSEDMTAYTKLNLQRMSRLNKTAKINEALKTNLEKIQRPIIWLILTEGWCGDAAQNVPVLAKMAAQNKNIQLKLILRDENLEIMDQFLTNGGRSIPKLIALDAATLEVLYTWGPRPEPVQKMMLDYKKDKANNDFKAFVAKIQAWYNQDKTQTLQKEISELITQ